MIFSTTLRQSLPSLFTILFLALFSLLLSTTSASPTKTPPIVPRLEGNPNAKVAECWGNNVLKGIIPSNREWHIRIEGDTLSNERNGLGGGLLDNLRGQAKWRGKIMRWKPEVYGKNDTYPGDLVVTFRTLSMVGKKRIAKAIRLANGLQLNATCEYTYQ